MWWDTEFNLIEHGDRYERLWWPLLRNDFPEWEIFWIRHVVPLTYRIDNKIENSDPKKLFLRDDAKNDTDIESMVMSNYSVFYYMARAAAILVSEIHLFPEDVLFLLRATTENVERFINKMRVRLSSKFSIDKDKFPEWKSVKDSNSIFKTIQVYRDHFAHFPRLGRNPTLEWEFIPKLSYIDAGTLSKNLSWSYVQNLPASSFEDGRRYLQQIQSELAQTLNPLWRTIRELMDTRRSSQEYRTLYRLDPSGKPLPSQQAVAKTPG